MIAALVLAAATITALDVPARVGVMGEAKLTLNEVIQRVLANDKDLAVSRINRDEATINLRGARGAFDPVLGLTAHSLRSVTPVSSSLGGASNGKVTTKELLADPSISGASPYLGTTYKLDFSSARTNTDSTFATLNPQFPTSANLNLTQPLWRGLLYDNNRHRISVAKANIQITGEQLRQRIIETVTLAVQAYRELQFAQRNLEVQLEAVRLAEQQDASNRRQVEQGLLAPVDITQTQTQIAIFQQNMLSAQQAVTAAENALKVLITPDRSDPLWNTELVPEDMSADRPTAAVLDDAIRTALDARPELKQNMIALAMNTLDVKRAHEQSKPQIDANATLSTVGLAGTPPSAALLGGLSQFFPGGVVIPPVLIGDYGQSVSNLTSGHFTTASVGVTMSFPIRNRTAEANSALAASETKRLEATKKQVELAIEQDVRNAVQAVSTAGARLDAASNARKDAEDQYASEQRQFQAGTSTVFLVLQRQTDLISARTREARARADLGEAAANLDRATARTLTVRNIDVK